MLAGFQPPARGAVPADMVYLESDSASGNSILAYRFNFNPSPVHLCRSDKGEEHTLPSNYL